ncbi:MAG: hypothetical protein LBF22_14800 [Deltaproteobacteria bacterium]|nr:hypothetical protein [Deltaproteobacteria bacterium]
MVISAEKTATIVTIDLKNKQAFPKGIITTATMAKKELKNLQATPREKATTPTQGTMTPPKTPVTINGEKIESQ